MSRTAGRILCVPVRSFDRADVEQFAERLLLEGKVAAVPGHVFGKGGEGFLRCCYATSVVQLTEALERIHQFLRSLE